MTGFTIQPIGTLHTPWRSVADCPRNGRQPDPAPTCTVHVLPAFAEGLRGLAGFSHLILLYWLDRATQPKLTFTPPFDPEPRGVFSTRAPFRPNPIGLSVVVCTLIVQDLMRDVVTIEPIEPKGGSNTAIPQ